MNRARKVLLEGGLQALVILSPLAFGLVYPWGAMTVSGLIFLLAAFHPEFLREISFLPRFFTITAVLLLFHIALQFYFTSIQPHATGEELLKWLAAAVLFLLVQRLSEKKNVFRLLFVLTLAGMAEAIYGLYEVKTGHEHVLWQAKESYQGFVTGTYLNRNHLAGFLELCLGIQLGFLIRACEQKRSAAALSWAASGILVLTALLQTGSRMGTGSFLFSLFFCLFFLKNHPQRKYWWAGLTGLIAVSFFFLGGSTLLGRLDLSEGLKNFDGGRGILWQNALVMLKDHALVGSGLGTFEWGFPAYQAEKFLSGWDHVHQDYLELAIELGIPAFLMLAVTFSVFIKKVFENLKRMDKESWPLVWGALVSILSLSFHGLADFNFAIPANTFLFILVLASACRLQKEEAHD